jgi:gamma-glutamylcyclotransferase (GGCT)/AIG2-like uncharacterized protein YtfP
MQVFCYGTLMVPPVWKQVVGRHSPRVDAVLKNYASRCVQGACYPGLVPKPGARTRGVVYLGVTQKDLWRLDRYEGQQYKRVRVPVCINTDDTISAWCYVMQARYLGRLSGQSWSPQVFAKEHMQAWLRNL